MVSCFKDELLACTWTSSTAAATERTTSTERGRLRRSVRKPRCGGLTIIPPQPPPPSIGARSRAAPSVAGYERPLRPSLAPSWEAGAAANTDTASTAAPAFDRLAGRECQLEPGRSVGRGSEKGRPRMASLADRELPWTALASERAPSPARRSDRATNGRPSVETPIATNGASNCLFLLLFRQRFRFLAARPDAGNPPKSLT